MPSVILSPTSAPWRDGSGLLTTFASPWRDGTLLVTTGSPFTPATPAPGDVPSVPSLAADYLLPASPFYSVVHTLTVIDLRDNTPVAFDAMTIATDADSVCWTLSATGPVAMFDRFTTGAIPAISVTIDGIEFRFLIEDIERNRQFGSNQLTVKGRSITALASDPYEFEQNWVNDGPTSAAQLADQAQVYTGLVVDWQLTDWLVPDAVWSFSGTPMAVVKNVADSVGAVVRSHRTDMLVSVMPRYRDMPNAWPTVAPSAEIHIDAAMVDKYTRADKPAYNGVYVSGQQQGVVGHVYLNGTAGDLLAPLVTDLLLTDIDAVRQRGESILGAAGKQATVQITLPVVTTPGAPGVLELGWLCRIVGDGPDPWYGVVRAVSLAVALPSILQTVTFERHTEYIDGTVITEED